MAKTVIFAALCNLKTVGASQEPSEDSGSLWTISHPQVVQKTTAKLFFSLAATWCAGGPADWHGAGSSLQSLTAPRAIRAPSCTGRDQLRYKMFQKMIVHPVQEIGDPLTKKSWEPF